MSRREEAADVLVGVAVVGVRVGSGSARAMLASAQIAARTPVVGRPLRAVAARAAGDGRRTREEALRWLGASADRVMAAPELSALIDRLVAGPLTEAVAQSLARNGVPRRVAVELLAATDVDATVDAVLDHPQTRALVDALKDSPALERLVLEAIDSQLTVELTDRVLSGPAWQHAIDHLASSPELRRAVAEQSAGIAEQTMQGVRNRSVVLDDAAERTVRRWLRRPRPQMS
ncbi:hypothetical protein DSM104299_01294 [Baekduia alba]|uniref:hypothetical protein n=1 Tax=Baekduia alba TaxID=2997333 RepID=UPI00233FA590|nr:hypothetical protein [Baekduia alba]WCB92597.1 hypothetical protein DSM104299_01294 [Baekduia alba]